MANKFLTVFQNLDKAISGNWDANVQNTQQHTNSYNMTSPNILYKTDDKNDYEKTKLELQQNNYLNNRWKKANTDLSVTAFSGLNNVKLMYRDADLMDSFPEIGAALDVITEESCVLSPKGQVVNVFSKSDRIKNIIEDLLVNRLDLQILAPMVIRAMCKYGNQFMLLNIDNKLGVTGWRQLPVFEVERIENGIRNPYGSTIGMVNSTDDADLSTKFVWSGEQQSTIPFRNWQIGHFRLLTDSIYLPYGVSFLNKARRHWRMLSLMEDMMLIYRLERSIERRVYKIFVGAIDDADVQAYVEEIANNFKRTPIVDPLTGQIDLRKNLLSIDTDIFIPVRDPNASTPIDTLPAAQNLTAMDDIKFIQNKVLTALRIPKTFLNFEETTGDGKNLALMDIRFTRTINRIQQAFLMELTKIVSIHLYLMGFDDELTNFSLSMNNPSTQSEQLEIDNLQKKILAVRDAVTDPGNGIPIMSQTRALREIMKWSDKEIKDNLEEIRLEKGIAAELEKTSQIIKKTGVFDIVDRMYGETGAEYQDDQTSPQDGGDGGMSGGGGGGGFGGGLDDMGGIDDDSLDGDVSGEEGEMPTEDLGNEDNGDTTTQPEMKEPSNENKKYKKPLLTEVKQKSSQPHQNDFFIKQYLNHIDKKEKKKDIVERTDIVDKTLLINEDFNNIIKSIDTFLD